jgi:hypothetical protein
MRTMPNLRKIITGLDSRIQAIFRVKLNLSGKWIRRQIRYSKAEVEPVLVCHSETTQRAGEHSRTFSPRSLIVLILMTIARDNMTDVDLEFITGQYHSNESNIVSVRETMRK